MSLGTLGVVNPQNGMTQSWAIAADAYGQFDFVNNRAFVGSSVGTPASLMTTTRGSQGYAQNSAGQLILFGNGVPRITDIGLTVEQGSTNLNVWSQGSFAVHYALNGGAGATDNVLVAPDGTLTGSLLSVSSTKQVQGTSFSTTIGHSYVFSIYVQRGASATGSLQLNLQSGGGAIDFNFNTVTAGTRFGTVLNPTMVAVGGGWYRVSGVGVEGATGNGVMLILDYNNGGATNSYGVWGAQVEDTNGVTAANGANLPTSYMPTTNTTFSRAADNIFVTGIPFSTNQNTLYWQGQWVSQTGCASQFPSFIDAGPNPTTANDVYNLFANTVPAVFISQQTFVGGVNDGSSTATNTLPQNTAFKIAGSMNFNSNTSLMAFNGVTGGAGTCTGLSALNNSIGFGRADRGGGNFIIKNVAFWTVVAKTSTQLASLTT